LNISARLKIAGVSSAAVVVVMVAFLLRTTQQVEHELAGNQAASNILNAATALRYLTLEYVLHHEERALSQWRLRYASLSQLLASRTELTSTEEQEIVGEMRAVHESVDVLFNQLVTAHQERAADAGPSAVLEELETRLTGRMTNKTQAMITGALKLSERSRAGVLAAQRQASVAVAAFGGVVVLIVAATLYMAFRSIARPLARLRDGTATVGAGDLEFRLNITTKDEIGDLARAFDAMTERLMSTTVSRDELREQRAELQVTKEAADRANQAKSEFVSSMSHELRSPLNGILGYAQILERAPELSPKSREGIQVIKKSGEHLLTLINDVLDLAKIEAGRMELAPRDFPFSAFLRAVVNLSKVRADQKKIEFVEELRGPALELVHADEKRLMQVLLNLLGNAIKFTEKGRVTLRVEVLEEARKASHTVRFRVEDTGPGIAPEHLASIFEPFEQVGDQRAKSEGTGLGLAITKALVEQMGGTLEVQSELGRGSAFVVTLDLAEVQGPAGVAQASSWGTITGYQGERRSILVVDDNPTNRAVLRELLTPLGFEISEAEGGEAALLVAQQRRPALILMDLAMPGMDGCEATRRLRRMPELGGVAILACSASISKERIEESARAGCDDFLAKPIEAGALIEQLGRHLGLDWIRKGSEAPPATQQENVALCIPPGDVLAALLDLADQGRLEELVEEADRLEREDARLGPWLREVRALAGSFELDKLCARLRSDADAVATAAPM